MMMMVVMIVDSYDDESMIMTLSQRFNSKQY